MNVRNAIKVIQAYAAEDAAYYPDDGTDSADTKLRAERILASHIGQEQEEGCSDCDRAVTALGLDRACRVYAEARGWGS